ncbi:hypothetical protein [Streptomyces sp. 184]|uniref:hypothetical protein n=1 Tax=Streptomyces sp. 184 TaxID=1827526 RepID=UPI0038922F9C
MTTPDSSARRRARPSAARGAAGSLCAALALAAALTGCGSDWGDIAGASGSATPSRSAEPSAASPTPAPTKSSASPSPTAAEPMKPSTAAELAACADGSCTIVVTKDTEIPAAPGLRAGPFTVTDVGAAGVDLTSTDPSGFVASIHDQLPDQGGASSINELSIAVLAIAGDTAKLRLFPAE